MNIWHDLEPELVKPESFTAVIEIEKGGSMKYELDKATGMLRLDRVLYTATHYPANYGFIPLTYGDDGDPLDVLVLCSKPIVPLCLVQCRPIGVVEMWDSGAGDEKIIALPLGDPTYSEVNSIYDLPGHIFQETEHFFTVYKQLEGRETSVTPVQDRQAALDIIQRAIAHYHECFGGK